MCFLGLRELDPTVTFHRDSYDPRTKVIHRAGEPNGQPMNLSASSRHADDRLSSRFLQAMVLTFSAGGLESAISRSLNKGGLGLLIKLQAIIFWGLLAFFVSRIFIIPLIVVILLPMPHVRLKGLRCCPKCGSRGYVAISRPRTPRVSQSGGNFSFLSYTRYDFKCQDCGNAWFELGKVN